MILCENQSGQLPTDLIFSPFPPPQDIMRNEDEDQCELYIAKYLLYEYVFDFLLHYKNGKDFRDYYSDILKDKKQIILSFFDGQKSDKFLRLSSLDDNYDPQESSNHASPKNKMLESNNGQNSIPLFESTVQKNIPSSPKDMVISKVQSFTSMVKKSPTNITFMAIPEENEEYANSGLEESNNQLQQIKEIPDRSNFVPFGMSDQQVPLSLPKTPAHINLFSRNTPKDKEEMNEFTKIPNNDKYLLSEYEVKDTDPEETPLKSSARHNPRIYLNNDKGIQRSFMPKKILKENEMKIKINGRQMIFEEPDSIKNNLMAPKSIVFPSSINVQKMAVSSIQSQLAAGPEGKLLVSVNNEISALSINHKNANSIYGVTDFENKMAFEHSQIIKANKMRNPKIITYSPKLPDFQISQVIKSPRRKAFGEMFAQAFNKKSKGNETNFSILGENPPASNKNLEEQNEQPKYRHLNTETKMRDAIQSIFFNRKNTMVLNFKRAVRNMVDDCSQNKIAREYSQRSFKVRSITRTPQSYIRKIQKICSYLIVFGDIDTLCKFYQAYSLSPFYPCIGGNSYLHIACIRRNIDFLIKLTSIQYRLSKNSTKTIDMNRALQVSTIDTLDTPFHLCAKFDFIRGFQYLKKLGAKFDDINLRGWSPLELARDTNLEFVLEKKDYRLQNIKRYISGTKQEAFNSLTCSNSKLKGYDIPYVYCIIAKNDVNPSRKEALVHSMLLNIETRFQGKVFFQVIQGYKSIKKSSNLFAETKKLYSMKGDDERPKKVSDYAIYLIGLDKELARSLADEDRVKVYDMFLNYQTTFDQSKQDNYEPFRDTQLQAFLVQLFSFEFDMRSLTKQGLILDHFPVHHFHHKARIIEFWRSHFFVTFFSSLWPMSYSRSFRPLAHISFYHGLQVGFLMGFITTYTVWLLPLGILLTGLQGLGYYLFREQNNPFVIFFCLIIDIWSSIFYVSWRRREMELSIILGSQFLRQKEFKTKSPSFRGTFDIDEISKEVREVDYIKGKYRRLCTDLPLFAIAFAMVVCVVLASRYFYDEINKRDPELLESYWQQ